jgi:predicted nucleotidyltransferase
MVPLTPRQLDALADVKAAWPDTKIALIGALALACHIRLQRLTDDLDLVVAIAADGLPGPLATRPAWTPHPRMEHRFFYLHHDTVDILPASPELIAQGFIEWPSGNRMSLVGFDLVFDHGAELDMGNRTSLWVPSAATIALLKMCAWLDRPDEREKDLGDLAQLLDAYVGSDDDRRWSDDVIAHDLDFEDVSPFVIGRDLRAIRRDHHRPAIATFLEKVSPAALTLRPRDWFDIEPADRVLRAFTRGLEEA